MILILINKDGVIRNIFTHFEDHERDTRISVYQTNVKNNKFLKRKRSIYPQEFGRIVTMTESRFRYFSDFECERCLPWTELTNRLEIAMEQFSKGEVIQPVRSTLKINELDGSSFCEFLVGCDLVVCIIITLLG